MRALSVKQPWASLIATGEKTIELRSWRTHYRGPLLIVASARPDRRADLDTLGCRTLDRPRGVALALVELCDVRPFARGDERHSIFNPGGAPTFSWLLRASHALEPPYVSVLGRLGIFHLDDDATVRAVRRNLARRASR